MNNWPRPCTLPYSAPFDSFRRRSLINSLAVSVGWVVTVQLGVFAASFQHRTVRLMASEFSIRTWIPMLQVSCRRPLSEGKYRVAIRRLTRDEIGDRGTAIYLSKLRPLLEPQCRGQFVAIDVETEDYEVANDADVASDRLWKRRPTAQILVERIGHPAVFHALGMVGRP